jgi:hypothetical protein
MSHGLLSSIQTGDAVELSGGHPKKSLVVDPQGVAPDQPGIRDERRDFPAGRDLKDAAMVRVR